MKRILRVSSLLVVLILGAANPAARAAEFGDAKVGRALTERWCTGCHITAPGQGNSDAAPSLTSLANNPAKSPVKLKIWLMAPHPPMPDFQLSRQAIADIVAYVESLKRR
jgi:mono/diheme cytochrome c family protein